MKVSSILFLIVICSIAQIDSKSLARKKFSVASEDLALISKLQVSLSKLHASKKEKVGQAVP